MKKITYLFIAAATCFTLSCSPEGEDNKTVEPTLTAAAISSSIDSIKVDLDNYTPIELIWTAGSWDGDGIITYTAVVDKVDGDFTRPVKVLNPALGTLSVSVSESDIQTIFDACVSAEDSTSATAKWAVKTSAGGNTLTSKAQFIKMSKSSAPVTPGPGPGTDTVAFQVGADIFVAGEGALDPGQKMTYVAENRFNTSADGYQDGQGGGVYPTYEIFTKIEAGKDFHLVYGDSASEPDGYLLFSAASLNAAYDFLTASVAPATAFKVENTGVYRIRISSAGKILIQAIGDVVIRCFGRELNTNSKWNVSTTTDIPMEYQGEGVWKASDVVIKWGNAAYANRYDTYKFAFTMNGSNTQLYATMNPSADNPTAETDATYWALQPALGGGLTTKGAIRWPSWLLSETKNPAYTADVVLYMNFSKGNYYTHAFENEKEIPE